MRQRSANETATWMIGQRGSYTVNSLVNGSLNGYSADIHNNNLIIKNITKNDDRNETDYQCVISIATPGAFPATAKGNITILYVAGEYCNSI